VTIPPVALQRGPEGLYTWVVKPDNTVDQRKLDATPIGTDTVIVNKGLTAGERVVVNGQYRLQPGARVDAKAGPAGETAAADNPS
jgi:multidrug efflux system membrane fusion protein